MVLINDTNQLIPSGCPPPSRAIFDIENDPPQATPSINRSNQYLRLLSRSLSSNLTPLLAKQINSGGLVSILAAVDDSLFQIKDDGLCTCILCCATVSPSTYRYSSIQFVIVEYMCLESYNLDMFRYSPCIPNPAQSPIIFPRLNHLKY